MEMGFDRLHMEPRMGFLGSGTPKNQEKTIKNQTKNETQIKDLGGRGGWGGLSLLSPGWGGVDGNKNG